jgi:hypothetical protein
MLQIVTRDVSEYAASPPQRAGTATILAGTSDVALPIATILEFARSPGAPAELKEFAEALVREQSLEEEYTAAMSKFRKNVTGVDNTIFFSAKFPRHRPRIKVAIDPPTHVDSSSDGNASVAIADGERLAGPEMPSWLRRQVEWFLELNRGALMDYWEKRIDDDELRERLLANKAAVEAGRPR